MGIASIENNFYALVRFCGNSKAIARIAGVNCIIFLLLMLAGFISWLTGSSAEWTERILLLPAPWEEAVRHPWTLLTYMLTQYSPLHLIFNMLWLICFGGILREYCPDRTILILYLAGGIAGGLLFESAATLEGSSGTLCGSSAAVLCVMTASAIKLPERRIRLWLLGEVKLKWIAAASIILTFAGGATATAVICAHAGGVAVGIISGICLRQSGKKGTKPSIRRAPTPKTPTKEGVRKLTEALDGKFGSPERLDELLDKIRLSGYPSLSRQEQTELEEISRRLKHPKR